MIYLDNAATTYPKPENVYEAVDCASRNLAFNAGRGSYKMAHKGMLLMDSVRRKIKELVKAPDNAITVLTPSATIAINEILGGIEFFEGDVVYVSPYEHNAIIRTLELIRKKRGIKVVEIPLKEETLEIDISKLQYRFTVERPKCVCMTHVSNVTGYILPVQEVFEMAKNYEAITVLDAAQSIGLLEIDMMKYKADFLVFAGHKALYGVFGSGGFVSNEKVRLHEVLAGGTGTDSLNASMPKSGEGHFEPASPNIIAIAALDSALDECVQSNVTKEQEKGLLEYLIEKLKKIHDVKLYLPPDGDRIGMVSLNMANYKSDDVGMILDQDYDIAVRTGYHCAPLIHKYLEDVTYLGTVRISLGRYTKKSELDCLLDALKELVE